MIFSATKSINFRKSRKFQRGIFKGNFPPDGVNIFLKRKDNETAAYVGMAFTAHKSLRQLTINRRRVGAWTELFQLAHCLSARNIYCVQCCVRWCCLERRIADNKYWNVMAFARLIGTIPLFAFTELIILQIALPCNSLPSLHIRRIPSTVQAADRYLLLVLGDLSERSTPVELERNQNRKKLQRKNKPSINRSVLKSVWRAQQLEGFSETLLKKKNSQTH